MHLFPESGFDQSAITPVFLGVLLSWLFTETLGWVFVGLVVPGYLATLFWLDPRSACIDVMEAVLTYWVARALCEHLSRTGLTSRLFGRERFLAILVVSVLVRLALEGALIPLVLPHARWAYSIGLVVVPLAANACWKTGLVRGLFQNGVTTLLVYALLRWVLIAHTNLSLAGFHLSIESAAGIFLRSPHAYVLLLTGAILAAAANVRYGWDYGGILIPALVSLVVTTPVKFAATFLEAGVLVLLVGLLLRFTTLGTWNIEGPRRAVLFLSADYVLRFTAAAALGHHLPGTEIVELSGLGYLLPSLLAVKVSQKANFALVLIPTAIVSTAAFGLSSAFAAAAGAVGDGPLTEAPVVTRQIGMAPERPLLAALWLSALARPSSERGTEVPASGRAEAVVLATLSAARRPQATPPPGLIQQELQGNVVLLRERFGDLETRLGSPAVLFSRRSNGGPRRVALLPRPRSAAQAAALAGAWLERGALDALVVAGTESTAHDLGASEAFTVARRLADSGDGHGLLISLRRSAAGCRVRLRTPSRVDRSTSLFIAQNAELNHCEVSPHSASAGEDVALDLPDDSADGLEQDSAAPPSVLTSSALALLLGEARLVSARPTLEDLLALRLLVLEPMLAPARSSVSLALSTMIAPALGFRMLGPIRLPTGDDGRLLVPGPGGAALAVLARDARARGPVLEVPHAGNRALRSFAVRISKPLDARALILGLEADEGALGNETFATAHALATWQGGQPSPSIAVVREGQADASIGLASWGETSARRPSLEVGSVLDRLGLTWIARPMDPATREQAARAVFDATPLVALSVPSALLKTPAFAFDPEPLRRWSWLAARDVDSAAALISLAASIPPEAPDAPAQAMEMAKRAASEESIGALRLLQAASADTALRLGLVRADSGVYLAVVARRAAHLDVAVYPLLFGRPSFDDTPTRAPSLAECGRRVADGGLCSTEVAP